MIWTILIIIISCIAGIGVILGSLVIFPTVYFGAHFSYSGNKKSISVKSWWLHPWVARVTIDPFSHHTVITFFGYTLKKWSGKNTAAKSPDDVQQEKEKKQSVAVVRGTTDDGDHCNKKSAGLPETEKKVEHVLEIPLDHKPSEELKSSPETEYLEKKTTDEVPVEPSTDHFSADRIKEQSENEVSGTAKSGQVESKPDKVSFFKRYKSNRYLFFARNRAWQRKTLRWLIRFIKYLLKVLVFDRFVLTIKAGIEEPSLLGKVFGFYEMVRYGLKVGRGYHQLRFEPVFMKYHFECDGSFGVKTSVAQVLFPLLVALATFPYFTTLLLYWKSRKLKRI